MHRESEKKLDPFDVEALEKSLNDSAVRVSAIWVTFILFVLYLAIASAGVTQRQLFLEEPIKLPALNIDLAFVGFWFVSPLLLVIFHLYVVIQLVLLSRTAAAYNEAIDQRVKNDAYNSRIRQRLANTLFAQLFAGSPRERRGTLGVLLKVLAWTTLAIGPLSVLFLLQLSFLPYHSHAATWAHRALIAVDLAIVMLLWPAALDPRRDLDWNDIIGRRRPFAAFGKLLGSTAVLLFAVLALSFPGEPHAQWARTQAATDDNATMLFTLSEENDVAPTPECTSKSVFARFFSESFDRFSLSNEFFVDDDNVTKIIGQRRTKDRLLGLAERTRKFSKRDLSCGDFSLTDLRLADFSDAILIGANFAAAYLQGARFEGANARSASFAQARIDGALFSGAQLRGATFESSAGRLARFNRTLTRKAARLQGAKLDYADFAGARFGGSELHGASFRGADLRLAEFVDWISFDSTKLYGADFYGADLRGADFTYAKLQGANLANARLGAAILKSAQLQGASFQNSVLTLANFTEAAVWRGHAIGCLDAYVEDPNVSPSVDTQARAANQTFVQLGATRQILEKWVRDLIAGLPEAKRAELEEIFYIELMAGSVEEDRANGVLWRRCEAKRDQEEVFLRKRATFFGEMVCADTKRLSDVIVDVPYLGSDVNLAVGTRLLGQDSKLCPGAEGLLEDRKQKLREWITGSTSG